jgi:hypothetical protein
MPVTYRVNKASKIIRTRCIGPVTVEEVIGVLARDAHCRDHLDVLLDLSKQTSVPTKDKLRGGDQTIGSIDGNVQFGTCAIVRLQRWTVRMLRTFEVLTEKCFHEIRAFRTTEEAEAWLASRRAVAGAGIRGHSSVI